MLYTDDTVILSDNVIDMQRRLDALERYCRMNDLEINVRKTEMIIFLRGGIRKILASTFNRQNVEVAFNYTYLPTGDPRLHIRF